MQIADVREDKNVILLVASLPQAGGTHATAPTLAPVNGGVSVPGLAAQAGFRNDEKPIHNATEPSAKLPRIMNIAL